MRRVSISVARARQAAIARTTGLSRTASYATSTTRPMQLLLRPYPEQKLLAASVFGPEATRQHSTAASAPAAKPATPAEAAKGKC
jgi:hypothetical protein